MRKLKYVSSNIEWLLKRILNKLCIKLLNIHQYFFLLCVCVFCFFFFSFYSKIIWIYDKFYIWCTNVLSNINLFLLFDWVMIKKIWVTMILIGTKFPSPLEMTNLLLHTHESWIEPLTTCLREPNSLPLGPIHCWLKFIYLMVKKYVHGTILFYSYIIKLVWFHA
jgi:hypothetical protein